MGLHKQWIWARLHTLLWWRWMEKQPPQPFPLSSPRTRGCSLQDWWDTHVLVVALLSPRRVKERGLELYEAGVIPTISPPGSSRPWGRSTVMAGEQKTSAGLTMGQTGFCLHCLETPNPPRLTASVSNALWGTMKDRNVKINILKY